MIKNQDGDDILDQSSVRDDIERIIKELSINRLYFFEVGKKQWQDIINNLEEEFLEKKHYSRSVHWGWEVLQEPRYALRFLNDDGYKYLNEFIDEDIIWLIAEDYKNKMWVYEGKADVIISVIAESIYLKEYYLVSKKYEWILCENHHAVIFGSGNKVVNKMRAFSNRHSDKLLFMGGI